MKIIGKMFKNLEEAKKFWDDSAYDVLDIIFALADNGLQKESLKISQIFSEDNLMKNLTVFDFNFPKIKAFMGIPKEYVSRNVKLKEGMKNINLPRDKTLLQFPKKEMKIKVDEIFSIFNDDLEELKEIIKKFKK